MKTPLHLSLRAKITIALLLTGLMSAVLVGVIARLTFLQQFNRASFEMSLQAFSGDVAAYAEAYGSIEAAQQAESFREFVLRRRDNVPAPSRTVGAGAAARPPDSGPRTGGPPDGEGGPPRGFVPTFFFVALDLEGQRVPGIGPPSASDDITPELRAQARPILARNQVVAYAVPIQRPNINLVDETYLDAMQSAMLYGIVGAGVMALALGFFFSGRLSANLRALTQAIQAISGGDLRQHVRVRSHDEVGFLGESFNRMSQELAVSHDTIREQAARMREMATTDELTQLHNRRFFDERAAIAYAQAQRYRRPFAVAIGDVDHFKRINDTYSHAMGDSVLRQVARILSAGTRETDIVARYGGEEFVIAFAETPLRDAAATCERIRRTIEEYPWQEVHPDLRVTITIGVDGEMTRGNVRRMVEAADELLYTGKQTGRNRVCFEAEPAPA